MTSDDNGLQRRSLLFPIADGCGPFIVEIGAEQGRVFGLEQHPKSRPFAEIQITTDECDVRDDLRAHDLGQLSLLERQLLLHLLVGDVKLCPRNVTIWLMLPP